VPGATLGVPRPVVRELERLATEGVREAIPALALAATLRPIEAAGRGDAAVVRAAVVHRAVVVTADRALQERLRAEGVDVLVPRDHARLERKAGRSRPGPARRPVRRPRGGADPGNG
jgi:rRNA-processing protein FCF1